LWELLDHLQKMGEFPRAVTKIPDWLGERENSLGNFVPLLAAGPLGATSQPTPYGIVD
jgi:hypothetical protein